MLIDKIRKINYETCEKVMTELEKKWSYSDFEILSQVIDNMKDLSEIETYSLTAEVKAKKMNAREVTTEFERVIYDIFQDPHTSNDDMIEVVTVIAELMEDLKMLNPRAYDITIKKLKGI